MVNLTEGAALPTATATAAAAINGDGTRGKKGKSQDLARAKTEITNLIALRQIHVPAAAAGPKLEANPTIATVPSPVSGATRNVCRM